MGKTSAKKAGERGEAPRDARTVEGRYWNENVFARPNGLREKAETAISCRGPGPTRKKKEIYKPVVERRGTWLQICARVAHQ